MIEINLLPGSVKKTRRKSPGLSAGPLSKLQPPKLDRVLGAAIAMWVVAVAGILWMHLSTTSRLDALTIEEEALIADTARYGRLIAQNSELAGKMDTVASKLIIIQELDAGRYYWPHILDEVSRAVPEYTWLTSITPDAATGAMPSFVIEGLMGNAFALPKFMKQLEESPFIANVTLRASAPAVEGNKNLYSFQLEAQYEEPPIDLISTVPLFPSEGTDSLTVPGAAVTTPDSTDAAQTTTAPAQPGGAPAQPAGAAAQPAGRN